MRPKFKIKRNDIPQTFSDQKRGTPSQSSNPYGMNEAAKRLVIKQHGLSNTKTEKFLLAGYGDMGSEKISHQRRWALLQYSLLRYEGLFMRYIYGLKYPFMKYFFGWQGRAIILLT